MLLLLNNKNINFTNNPTYWVNDNVIDILKSFASLEDGWDCGIGTRISQDVIDKSIHVYSQLKEPLFGYECTPNSNNSIEIIFYLKDYFLNIAVFSDEINATVEKGIGSDYDITFEKQNISISEIKTLLRDIKQKCFSLEPSISTDIKQVREDLKNVSTSSGAAYLYSTIPAPKRLPSQFVSI